MRCSTALKLRTFARATDFISTGTDTSTGWTFNSSAGVSGNESGFTAGIDDAPEGVQVAFLQGNGGMTQLANFSAGTYTISFESAQRTGFNSQDEIFEVWIDGSVVGTFEPADDGTYHSEITSSFTVTAGEHAIEFDGIDPDNIDISAFVDDVQVNDAGTTTATPPVLADAGFESPDEGNETGTDLVFIA